MNWQLTDSSVILPGTETGKMASLRYVMAFTSYTGHSWASLSNECPKYPLKGPSGPVSVIERVPSMIISLLAGTKRSFVSHLNVTPRQLVLSVQP